MTLENWNTFFLSASVAFAILAALSTGAAIITGRALDTKKDAQIAQLQSRHITPEQREQLIALLKPVPKAPVFFNPLVTSGEAVQFSDEIKDVITAAGFEVIDADFGQGLLALNRTGAFLWFKDKENPPQHAKYIYEIFRRVGISFLGDPQADFTDPAKLVVVVGSHP